MKRRRGRGRGEKEKKEEKTRGGGEKEGRSHDGSCPKGKEKRWTRAGRDYIRTWERE